MKIHPCIFTVIWLGLVMSCMATPYLDVLLEVLPPVRQPIHLQQQLGWDQLYHGHVSHDWATAINSVHPMLHHTGKQVMILLQCIIWQYILDTWTLRNQHLHHTANQMLNLLDFHQAARILYEQRDWLHPDAQAALYQQPLEQILELPAPCLEQWVVQGHKYFNQQLKAAKQQV